MQQQFEQREGLQRVLKLDDHDRIEVAAQELAAEIAGNLAQAEAEKKAFEEKLKALLA